MMIGVGIHFVCKIPLLARALNLKEGQARACRFSILLRSEINVRS